MREYGKLFDAFWTGDTGRAIQAGGAEAVVLAAYLCTCRHATMLGLYYLPLEYAALETPLELEEVRRAMLHLEAVGFAHYCHERREVWLPAFARYQVGAQLKRGPKGPDKRITHLERLLAKVAKSPFYGEFLARYGRAYALDLEALPRPSEGPTEALRSQQQEQVSGTGTGAGAEALPACGKAAEAAEDSSDGPAALGRALRAALPRATRSSG